MRALAVLIVMALAAACSPSAPAAPEAAQQEASATPAPKAPNEISYACNDGLRFVIIQDLDAGVGSFQIEGGGPGVAVEKAEVASGFAYYGQGVRFHGKGEDAILNYRSDPERDCRLVAARPS